MGQVLFGIVLLFSSFSFARATESGSQKCSAERLAQIRAAVLPDISLNANFIDRLLKSAETGLVDCQITSTSIDTGGGRLAMCGVSAPMWSHSVQMGDRTQSWTLTIREDEVDCQPNALWLTEIKSEFGNVTKTLVAGDRIIAQREASGCEKPEDYTAVAYFFEQYGQKVNKITLLNGSNRICTDQKPETLIEFSAKQLGLSNEQLKALDNEKK